jgi:Transglycosylase SLT domain/Domain of unknown function (DUF4124)
MKRRLLAGLVPVTLAFLCGPALADIYAFVDGNGVRHLSNVPNDPRYKLVMRTPAYRKESVRSSSSFAPSNLYGSSYGALFSRNPARPAGRARLRVNEGNRQRFTPDVNRIAAQHRLDPALMHAVISAESSYNPWAVSPKGAMGLMQLMPGTAERFGVSNPYDPIANMSGGARYLRWLLDRFNDPRLAVAAYNAGEGAVQKYGNQIPPYQETQTYVVRVFDYYQKYRTGGAYATGYPAAASGVLASNSGSSYPNTAYSRGPGVVIITPRTSNSPASLTNLSSRSAAASAPRTFLPSTGSQVIIGNSSAPNRPPVRVNLPVRPAAKPSASAPLFAGNDQ